MFASGCTSEENRTESEQYSRINPDPVHSAAAAETIPDAPKPPELTKTSGLPDYLAYAALNNPGLRAEFEKWKASEEQIAQAKSLADPVLSYGYATEPTPQRSMFDVMQMFPWFGTIEARTDAASAMAKSAGKQYEAKKLTLFYEVKQAFYEYGYLARSVEITRENLELLRHFEEVVRIKYTTSTTTHPDVIRAQIELAKLENELISMERQRPAVIAKLNSILNRPALSDLPWPKAPQYKQVSIDSQRLVALATENNPELKALGHDIEAAESNQKLAEKRFYPEFGIGVGVDAGMGENMDSRTMPKIQLTLPIWRENYKAAQRQAEAQSRQASQEKNQLVNTLAANIQKVFYEFENSSREIVLYRDVIIPKTKELLMASETAYQAGTVDFLNLIDAQRTLLEYRLDYERAVAYNARQLAELEMLAGAPLTTSEKDSATP
jgi:outer membrane protein TolC